MKNTILLLFISFLITSNLNGQAVDVFLERTNTIVNGSEITDEFTLSVISRTTVLTLKEFGFHIGFQSANAEFISSSSLVTGATFFNSSPFGNTFDEEIGGQIYDKILNSASNCFGCAGDEIEASNGTPLPIMSFSFKRLGDSEALKIGGHTSRSVPGDDGGFIYAFGTDESPAGSGGTFIVLDGTADGDYTVTNGTQQLVPVEYTFFKASKQDKFSSLTWETVSEIDNDYFNVERSADGKTFETIGKVAGNGTTNDIQNYEFLDRAPLAGLNYYRLKQVDFNGAYEYSKVETVDFRDGTEGDVSIFPNPSIDYVQVSLDRAYDGVRVTNQLGQLVEVLPASLYESNQFKMDISHYTPGVYFLEARLGHEIVNKQFVKVK